MTLQVLERFGINIINDNYKQFSITGNQKYKPVAMRLKVTGAEEHSCWLPVLSTGILQLMVFSPDSLQSDKAILTALEKAGAKNDISLIIY